MTCELGFDLEAKYSFLDFVAAGGIVFHKHTLIFSHKICFVLESVWPVRCTAFLTSLVATSRSKSTIWSGNWEACIPHLPDTCTTMG